MDAPMMKMDKEMQKKREAMKKRLAALGKDNPVVAAAVKNQDPVSHDQKWQDWNVVDELVNAARRKFFDGEGEKLSGCLTNLGNALLKLASNKGIDTGKKSANNDDSDEDY